MTNDLRIADAPLLVDVSGEEKLPTGGYGNYSTTINQIADHTIARGDLVSHGDLSQVEVSLGTQITDLENDVASADNSIRGLIAAEEAARIAKDLELQQGLSDEAVLRVTSDADLSRRVSVISNSLSSTVQTFTSTEAGLNPVTGVADGAYFNVRSSDTELYADEYQNVGGSAVSTGRSYPSSAALKAIDDKTTQLLFPFITMERLGGSTEDDGTNNVLALREYFRGAATGEYGTLLLGRGTYNLNDAVVSTSPVSIKGVGTSVIENGAYSAFADVRTSGDSPLIKFSKGNASTIGLTLDSFEVLGRGRVASGVEFDISGWVTHVRSVTIQDFRKNGAIFQTTNDGLFVDFRVLSCGSNVDGVPYYAIDFNPALLTAHGGSNQLNFIRPHVEHTRYMVRMRNWLCNFYGGHFEIGAASKIVSSQDWTTPLFDIWSVNYQNCFFGCNFIYPSIYLYYLANNKVGGSDFFENVAPVFGSTNTNFTNLNDAVTNVLNFVGCTFIPNGGTSTDAIGLYMYGYKLFDLPKTQVKLSSGCSLERIVSTNRGRNIKATTNFSSNDSLFHFHIVSQSQIDSDTENATLLTHFKTTVAEDVIWVASNDARRSVLTANTFYAMNPAKLYIDESPSLVSEASTFVVSGNSGVDNKFPLIPRDTLLPTRLNLNTTNYTVNLRGTSGKVKVTDLNGKFSETLADSTQGTFYVVQSTPVMNRIQRHISSASTGIYEESREGGHYTIPVTNNTGGYGSSTNRFKEVHVTDLAVYPPAINNPTSNGEMTFELTSNTELKVKVRGSDGVTRTATLTLA